MLTKSFNKYGLWMLIICEALSAYHTYTGTPSSFWSSRSPTAVSYFHASSSSMRSIALPMPSWR